MTRLKRSRWFEALISMQKKTRNVETLLWTSLLNYGPRSHNANRLLTERAVDACEETSMRYVERSIPEVTGLTTATGIAAVNSTSAAAAKPLKISLLLPFAWLALAALVSPVGVIPEQFQTELAKPNDEWARFFRGLTLASVGIGSFALAMRQGLPGHLCFLSNGAATIAAATAMATLRGESYAEVVKSSLDCILIMFPRSVFWWISVGVSGFETEPFFFGLLWFVSDLSFSNNWILELRRLFGGIFWSTWLWRLAFVVSGTWSTQGWLLAGNDNGNCRFGTCFGFNRSADVPISPWPRQF